MKKQMLFFGTLLSILSINAQWTDNGTNLTTTDNVGIGTTAPTRKLQVDASYGSAQIQLNRTGSNLGKVDFGVDGDGLHFWMGGYDAFGNEEFFLAMDGDVGIGTNNPSQKLQIDALDRAVQVQLNRVGNNPGKVDFGVDGNGLQFWMGGYDGFGNEEFFLGMNGDVGIGTNNPSQKLQIDALYRSAQVQLNRIGNNPGKVDFGVDGDGLHFWMGGYDTFGNEEFFLGMNGDVGIGTNSPDAKLAVNGTIHAKEVKVDLIGWPDYVFNKDYRLPTLKEVEIYIKKKGHLKDIPSAKAVEGNGLFLGEINKKLLLKIEELTLYTIQQQKEIDELRQENKNLRSISHRVEKLEKLLLFNEE